MTMQDESKGMKDYISYSRVYAVTQETEMSEMYSNGDDDVVEQRMESIKIQVSDE